MPDLSILTVVHRSAEMLHHAQHTLAAKPPACDFEWIVVNHSPDLRVAPSPALASRMRVIDSPNVGFGRGVNTAARAARAPVLFLANPDLEFDGPMLDQGLAHLAADPGVGVLGPRLYNLDGNLQRTARRFYTWPVALYARLPFHDRWDPPRFWRRYLMLDDPLDRPCDVDWLLGAAFFVRREALLDPNGENPVFDPRYFLYFEDVDLCMDMWQRGWRVRYNPTLTAMHAHVRASRNLGSRAAFAHAESFVDFVLKWKGLPGRPQAKSPHHFEH